MTKEARYAAAFAKMKGKGQSVTPPSTPKDYPLYQETTRCLDEGLSPGEVHGMLSIVRSMGKNQNLLLKTEDVEAPDRFSEYNEEERLNIIYWRKGIS